MGFELWLWTIKSQSAIMCPHFDIKKRKCKFCTNKEWVNHSIACYVVEYDMVKEFCSNPKIYPECVMLRFYENRDCAENE